MDEYLEFLRRLRTRRLQLELTQQSLAANIGLSTSLFADIESGKRDITLKQFLELAKILNASPQTLMPSFDPALLLISEQLPYASFNEADLNRLKAMIEGVLRVFVSYDADLSKKITFKK